MTRAMGPTKEELSVSVEKLRRRLHAGEIDDAEFRAARDRLLERRVSEHQFDGPDRRATSHQH